MRESKLVVLGAGGVGKSSLLHQYLHGSFSSAYRPTVEDCYTHTVQLPNGLYHAFEILDTAGSHHFPAMRELSIRSGRAFVIIFAVNSKQSFYEAQSLCELIKQTKEVDNVPVVVVGNKIDLSAEREVSWQTASNYVARNISNGSYVETSAKYNLSISDVFTELLILAFGIPKNEKLSRPSRLSLSIGDMAFPSCRRKSSTMLSASSSSGTLSPSTQSYSDYSFDALGHGHSHDGSTCGSSSGSDCGSFQGNNRSSSVSASSSTKRRSLKQCLSALTSSSSSNQRRLHGRSLSMFSQGRKKRQSNNTNSEKNTEPCVFL